MPLEWDGNLRNTPTDVVIDTLVLLLGVCAYIPQIHRLCNATSARGISALYILFDLIFSNAQLSDGLLSAAYAYPTPSRPVIPQINDGSLTGMHAFGGVFGYLQMFVHWLCSILVLLSFCLDSRHRRSGRSMLIAGFLHTATVLFPAMASSLPKPAPHTFERDICMALIHMSNMVVAPLSVLLRVVAQLSELRAQKGDPGGLSLLSLSLQVLTFAALSLRWYLRIGRQTWGHHPIPAYSLYEWAFPAANYLMHAVGCALLLACYCFASRRTGQESPAHERTPLLP